MTGSVWRGRTAALLGILLVAMSLRTPVAALSPILDQISEDISLDPVVLGLIGAAPPLAFAASGFMAPGLARRFGLERTVFASLFVMCAGHVGRALAGESAMLAFATVVTLVGVGIGNVLLPSLVRRYFPDRVGLLTSLYAAILSVSTALPPFIAVPVADSLGWRWSLGIWMLVALIAAVPWVRALGSGREAAPAPGSAPAAGVMRMASSPTAWALGVAFGISSFTAYAGFAWLPSVLIDEASVSAAGAGQLLALFAFTGFPAALIVPLIAARFPRADAAMVLFAAFLLALGPIGLLVAPETLTWLWVSSLGLGTLLFPLILVSINLRSRVPSTTVALSGFAQTLGYVLGASGPVIIGVVHDASGSWMAPLIVWLVPVVLLIPVAAILARGRVVDDEI